MLSLATKLFLAAALPLGASARPYATPFNDRTGRLEVQAHRGGLGLRSEESLWAYAYAMEIGSDVLEMDLVFTADGVPVIWHDHDVRETKCTGEYVGQYIANLTLEQVKTLDCSVPLEDHIQQEIHPSTKIATLAEVLELINCYDTPGTTINLETKLDPLAPNETLPVDTYVTDIVPVLQEYGFEHRTVIQSFDWRTLIGIREAYPSIPLVALVDHTTVVPDETGAYPWLGGVSIDDFGGDWVAASASIGAKVLSPEHGYSAGNPVEKVSVNSKNYTAFVTKDIVDRAHQAGMQVIPWTVDEEVTISKLIDDGVDAIISNYPERVLWVGKQRGLSVGRARSPSKPECLAKA